MQTSSCWTTSGVIKRGVKNTHPWGYNPYGQPYKGGQKRRDMTASWSYDKLAMTVPQAHDEWSLILEEHDIDIVPPYSLAGDDFYSLAPITHEEE